MNNSDQAKSDTSSSYSFTENRGSDILIIAFAAVFYSFNCIFLYFELFLSEQIYIVVSS